MDRLLEKMRKMTKLVDENKEFLEKKYDMLRDEYSIIEETELISFLEKLDNEDRNLKIGIVGRVKAGKSSLLNSLFFNGKDILPKAATPMTASLTIIKYGLEFGAEVDFYTKEDLEEIIQNSKEYDNLYKKKYEEELEKFLKMNRHSKEKCEEIAAKNTKKDLSDNIKLDSAHDQYERMKKENAILEKILRGETLDSKLEAKNLEELQEMITDYVGAQGKYMPFTKGIIVEIPFKDLKGIEVIDTPGINDPVQSREQRTRQLLKECDVTLVISPTGQFLSEDDKNLMSRISDKEGINEIYIVGSQIDSILFTNEKENNNGIIENILKSVNTKLTSQMKEIVSKLDEIQNSDVYKHLKENGEIFLTSGMSHKIYLKLENNQTLDGEESHLYNELVKNYPNYFSDKEKSMNILNKISNISKIMETLEKIKEEKIKIIASRKTEYINSKIKSFEEFKKELIEEVENDKEKVIGTDLDEVNEEIELLDKKKNEMVYKLEELLEDEIYKLNNNLKEYTQKEVLELENEVSSVIDNHQEIEITEYKEKEKGMKGFFKRGLGWLMGSDAGYNIKSKKDYILDTNLVEQQMICNIENKKNELKDTIEDVVYKFKRNLSKILSKELNYILGDSIDYSQLKKDINSSLKSVKNSEINFTVNTTTISYGGYIYNSEINAYRNKIILFLRSLPSEFKNSINDYMKNLENEITVEKITDKILLDLMEERNKLKEYVENKKSIIDKYEEILNKIKSI